MSQITTAEQVLGQGLNSTFQQESHVRPTVLATINSTVSSKTFESDQSYIDIFVGSFKYRLTGGFEVGKAGDQVLVRTYNGGTIPQEELESLGVTNDQFIQFLKEVISVNPHTRLDSDIAYASNGFSYSYNVTSTHPLIQATTGLEEVKFGDMVIAQHVITISPVVES